jgi:hypothetical protein
MRLNAVMISSTVPSAKYSCSGSPLMSGTATRRSMAWSLGPLRARPSMTRQPHREAKGDLIVTRSPMPGRARLPPLAASRS